jgi:hypothetical protein
MMGEKRWKCRTTIIVLNFPLFKTICSPVSISVPIHKKGVGNFENPLPSLVYTTAIEIVHSFTGFRNSTLNL